MKIKSVYINSIGYNRELSIADPMFCEIKATLEVDNHTNIGVVVYKDDYTDNPEAINYIFNLFEII